MTRKDTILIAVVINAGLLAVLFTTAVIYDTEGNNENIEFDAPLVDSKVIPPEPTTSLIAVASTGDEVDNVLKYYTTSPTSQPILVQSQPETYIPEPMTLQSNAADDEDSSETEVIPFLSSPSQESVVEVTVKRGDVLEKIAKVNKTTVGAIKRANNLTSERLSIGQVLKIPVKQSSSTTVEEVKAEVKPEVKKEPKATAAEKSAAVEKAATAEPVYYTIKSGDNPWKIAKQFGIKYDEILRLNNMDEEKARNLKIGDRIRVK